MREYKWMKLDDVKRSIPAMAAQGVSEVARGIVPSKATKEGWVQAYIATKGSKERMAKRLTGRNDHETWKDRRQQFLARHLGRVHKDQEPLWVNGQPTRRHLALVAWGYTPDTRKFKNWLKTQPSLSSDEWKDGVRILKNNPDSDLRYEWGRTDSGIYHSSVYDKGKLVGTIGLKFFDREELEPQCYEDFEWVLREIEWESGGTIQDRHIDKWIVYDVYLNQSYQNKGIGYKMYENIFKIQNHKEHTIIVGYRCEPEGTTSYDAEKVYKRLQQKYIGKGLVVSSIKKDLPDEKPNPSTPKKPDSELYFEQYDLYSDRDPSDTISIKYSTVGELKDTIRKLERLYKTGQYTHARIVQVANILKQRIRVIFDNTGHGESRYKLAKRYFQFLVSQRTPTPESKRKELQFTMTRDNPYKAVIEGDIAMRVQGKDIPLRRNGAPGYQSYAWTTQDWRSLFLKRNGTITYDKKCGAEGTKLPSGKPRLCLPIYVIEQLMKSKKGKEILKTQIQRKQRAKKGQRVAWQPEIKELHRELESRTPKDRAKRNPDPMHELVQFFTDRDVRVHEKTEYIFNESHTDLLVLSMSDEDRMVLAAFFQDLELEGVYMIMGRGLDVIVIQSMSQIENAQQAQDLLDKLKTSIL